VVVALESTGYDGVPTARHSQLLHGWSVEKAKRMGRQHGQAAGLLSPQSPTASAIEDFVHKTSEECQRYDLGLIARAAFVLAQAGARLSSAESALWFTETARRLVIPRRGCAEGRVPAGCLAAQMKKPGRRLREISAASPALDPALGGSRLRDLLLPRCDCLSAELPALRLGALSGRKLLEWKVRAHRVPADHGARAPYPPDRTYVQPGMPGRFKAFTPPRRPLIGTRTTE